jgi:hypothetical protein
MTCANAVGLRGRVREGVAPPYRRDVRTLCSPAWRDPPSLPSPARGEGEREAQSRLQRMPSSISLVSASIVFGVTVPAPVLSDSPGILYLAVITHCTTGMNPCR